MDLTALKDELRNETTIINDIFFQHPTDGWVPMLTILDKDGMRSCFALSLDNFEAQKYMALQAIGRRAKEDNLDIDALFFSAEAWSKSFHKDDPEARHHKKPSEYADKKEVLIVLGYNLFDIQMIQMDIIRDEQNNIHLSTPTEPLEGAMSAIIDAFMKGYDPVGYSLRKLLNDEGTDSKHIL